MATRLNWEKNNLARKPTRRLKDEQEFHERDLAARWLERREKWEQTAAKTQQEDDNAALRSTSEATRQMMATDHGNPTSCSRVLVIATVETQRVENSI